MLISFICSLVWSVCDEGSLLRWISFILSSLFVLVRWDVMVQGSMYSGSDMNESSSCCMFIVCSRKSFQKRIDVSKIRASVARLDSRSAHPADLVESWFHPQWNHPAQNQLRVQHHTESERMCVTHRCGVCPGRSFRVLHSDLCLQSKVPASGVFQVSSRTEYPSTGTTEESRQVTSICRPGGFHKAASQNLTVFMFIISVSILLIVVFSRLEWKPNIVTLMLWAVKQLRLAVWHTPLYFHRYRCIDLIFRAVIVELYSVEIWRLVPLGLCPDWVFGDESQVSCDHCRSLIICRSPAWRKGLQWIWRSLWGD